MASLHRVPRGAVQGVSHRNIGRAASKGSRQYSLRYIRAVVTFAQMGGHQQVQTTVIQSTGELC